MELRYGQIIRIHGDFSDSQSFLKGLVMSKGKIRFTQTNVFYQTYTHIAKINNYRDGLFQLLPKGSFEIHDEYMKKNSQDDEKRLKTERDQYIALVEQKTNEEILFGQEIVLMHYDSETYLSSSNKCSEQSTEAFRIELSEHISSFALFKIVPYNTFQKEGQVVYVNESIRLLNEKQKCYLDIVNTKQWQVFDSEENCKPKDNNISQLIEFLKMPSDQDRFEVVLKSKSKASWKLKLHQSNEQIKQKNKIQLYDLITLQYTYNNSYLGVQIYDKKDENDVQLKIVLREMQNNQIPLDGVWEFQPVTNQVLDQIRKDSGGGSRYQKQNFEQSVMGSLSTPFESKFMKISDNQTADNQYILRHYITGKVLTISQSQTLQLEQMRWTSTSNQPNYCLEIQLARIGAEQDILQQSYVFLKYQKNFLQMKSESEWEIEDDSKFNVIIKKTIYFFKEVQLTKEECMHAFQILKIPSEVQTNIQFVLSAQEQLFQFVQVLQAKQRSSLFLIKINQMLVKLIQYLQINISQTKFFRQKSMRDLFILDLIIEMMHNIDDSSEKMQNISQRCFEFLKTVVHQNASLKFHVSRSIDFFLDQALNSDEPIVLKCLFEILDDNYQAISNFITEKEIQKIIKYLVNSQNHKFLRILSASCVCKKQAVPENQNFVLQHYFSVIQSFTFKIDTEHRIIIVSNDKEQTLDEILESSRIKFFRSYINLLADICTNRNQKSQQFVQHHLQIDILCSLIMISFKKKDKILQSFLKLFHLAFIDQAGLRKVRKIEKVYEWDKLEEIGDIPKAEFIPFEQVVYQIMQFVENFINSEIEYDTTLLYVLRILITTLELGFWRSRDDLKTIVQNLLKICSCKSDLGNDFAEQSLTSKELNQRKKKQNLMFKCKIVACHVIEIIYELDTGIRLNRLMQQFKLLNEKKKLDHEEVVVTFSERMKTRLLVIFNYLMRCPRKYITFENVRSFLQRQLGYLIEKYLSKHLERISRLLPQKLLPEPQIIKLGSEKISQYFQSLQTQQSNIQKMKDKFKKFKGPKNVKSTSQNELQLFMPIFSKIVKDIDLISNSQNSDEFNIDLILVEYSFFKNSKMLKSSLSLLNKIYQKRKILYQNFSELLILEENQNQQTKQLCIDIQNITNKLEKLEMRVYRRLNQIQDYDSDIMQELNILCSSLKTSYLKNDGKIVQKNLDSLNLSNVGVRLIFNEYEQNEVIHQELMKTLNAHTPILRFIGAFKENENDENLFKMLDISYEMLTLLIWNNAQNQSDIKFDLDIMYNHIQYNISCIDFLRELFHHNKDLLYNETEVTKFLKVTVEQINKQPVNSYYKSKLMDCLRILQYDQNQIIKSNQLSTLSMLQDKNYDSVIILEQEPNWSFELFLQWIEEYQSEYKNVNNELTIRPQLVYMSVHFQLLSLLVENSNSINLEKCRAMHPYLYLLNILSNSIDCWTLQNFVRAYVNRLYYCNNNYEQISCLLVERDLENIFLQLSSVVRFKLLDLNKSNITIKNAIRFNYLFTYVFATLQEILYSLNLIFVNEQFLLELEEQLDLHKKNEKYQLHKILCQIMVALDQIKDIWFKNSVIKRHSEKLSELIRVVIQCFTITDLSNILGAKLDPNKLDNEDNRRNLIEQIEKLIQNSFCSNTGSLIIQQQQKLKRVFYKKTVLQIQKDRQREIKGKNIKHKLIVNQLNQKRDFIQFLEEEALSLCDNLDNINNLIKKNDKLKSNINLKEFIKNVIQMNISNPDSLTDELRVFFLTVLVRMIEKKNTNPESRQKSIAEWTPEMSSDCRAEIENEQNVLDECGAASLIYQMFLDQNLIEKQELCSQLILFTISYLYGGNTQCQNSLLAKMKQDSTNSMLTSFCNLLNQYSKLVYSSNKGKNPTKSSSVSKQTYLLFIFYINRKQLLEGYNSIDNLNQFSIETDSLNPILPSSYKSRDLANQQQQSIEVFRRGFRMLQLLCENNNSEMKNFLREQTDNEAIININTINFIEYATKEFRIIIKILSSDFNENLNDIAIQIVEFTNEIIQLPCQLNQRTLCRSTYFEDASQYIFNSEKDLHDLQSKIIQSILLVLEGNDQTNFEDLQTKVEPKSIAKSLDSFIQAMDGDIKAQLTDNNSDQLFELFPDNMQQVFDVCIIMKKIEQKYPNSKWVKDIQEVFADSQEKYVFEFCMKNLQNIEIFYEGSYQTLYFPSHPVFKKLSGETRDKIMFEIPRETQREKLVNLLQQQETISNEIEYNFKLSQQIVQITHETITLLVNIGQWISFLINVLMVIFYEVVISNKQAEVSTGYWRNLLLRILSIIQLIISVMIFSFYIISRAPLELKKRQTKQEKKNTIIKFIVNQVKNCKQIIQSDDFLQYLIYLIISGFGIFRNTYYFSLHLFYLFGRLELLKSVFQAISYNAKQLTMVAMLGVLFQFVFSIVAFYNYVDDIYQEAEPEDPCQSLISCMITLMTSGVIGTSMSKWDPRKFFYDTLYFVFFALLFTNIISGIMIDTFAELRDKRQTIDDDKKNLCFICGIDRVTLEKQQEDFEDHIKNKHFLWNYAFYLYCLKKKDSTEYTGLEYWINDKVEKENITWFPIENSEESNVEQNLNDLNGKLDEILELANKKLNPSQSLQVANAED